MFTFSIIIATYNASLTLKSCLESIRIQKDKDVELIVIDGDSTDSTTTLIENNKDIVDIFIHEPDKGIYDAWNKGIKLSHGNWIMFIGADDTLLPNALNNYRQFLATIESKIDYISARINYIDDSNKTFKVIGLPWKWDAFKYKMTVAHVASLHNRELFNEIGLFNTYYKICADYEFLYRKENRLNAVFMNKVVANMKMKGSSMSTLAIKETCDICFSHIHRNIFHKYLFIWEKYFLYYCFNFRIYIWSLLNGTHK